VGQRTESSTPRCSCTRVWTSWPASASASSFGVAGVTKFVNHLQGAGVHGFGASLPADAAKRWLPALTGWLERPFLCRPHGLVRHGSEGLPRGAVHVHWSAGPRG